MIKLNAICMVKNEADVVAETLLNALAFCERIYVFDNGSDDGTWPILTNLARAHEQIVIAERSFEVFKNQLRNRVYNKYHHHCGAEDWWYILDADEMLVTDPRPLLEKAARRGANAMRVWQAQFYFTDLDLSTYAQEKHSLPVSQRRKHYRINWREPRFFKNDPQRQWPESVSGRLPPWCNRFAWQSPICRHYAQRTPEQIKARVSIRKNNPFSFFHLKNKPENDWLKSASDLFVYQGDGVFRFPMMDRVRYFLSEGRYWLQWRLKACLRVLKKLNPMSQASVG